VGLCEGTGPAQDPSCVVRGPAVPRRAMQVILIVQMDDGSLGMHDRVLRIPPV
jgi:hypothetical protein